MSCYCQTQATVTFSQAYLVFFAEPKSVEGDERGGSEVCVCPRHHHVPSSTASPVCLVSGSCSHQQPAGAGAALPGLGTQEGKVQHWTQTLCIAQKSCSTPSTGLLMRELSHACVSYTEYLCWWPLKSEFGRRNAKGKIFSRGVNSTRHACNV